MLGGELSPVEGPDRRGRGDPVRWEPSGSSPAPVSSRNRCQRGAAPRAGRAEVGVELVEQLQRPLRIGCVELAERDLLEQVVAPEQLVGPLTGRDDRDALLADLACEQVQRHRRGADERRLGVADHLRKGGGDLGGADVDDVMGGADRPRDLLLLAPLVVARVVEGDRERPQLALGLLPGRGR